MKKIVQGHSLAALRSLPNEIVDCCITSPPYFGLRHYGTDEQIWSEADDHEHIFNDKSLCECGAWKGHLGLEPAPEDFIRHLTLLFREVRRVLKKTGTLWVNIGDSYHGSGKGFGHNWENSPKQRSNKGSLFSQIVKPNTLNKHPHLKPKDLIGIPWMLAFALRADGWYLRLDIIWNKPNCMPESVQDRPTKSHEYIFMLSKAPDYFYDLEAVREPLANLSDENKGRNKRSVWNVNTKPIREAHFATYPLELITPCVLAGCPENGIVLDPFFGSGTTGIASCLNGRGFLGIELNPQFAEIAVKRIEKECGMFASGLELEKKEPIFHGSIQE